MPHEPYPAPLRHPRGFSEAHCENRFPGSSRMVCFDVGLGISPFLAYLRTLLTSAQPAIAQAFSSLISQQDLRLGIIPTPSRGQ